MHEPATQQALFATRNATLTPSQRFVYLGVVIDTVAMKFFLTDEKRRRISSSLAAMLQQHAQTGRVSLQSLASLIGLLNFAAEFTVPAGKLFLRSLEADKVQAVRLNSGYRGSLKLSEQSVRDLLYWQSSSALQQAAPIRAREPQAVLQC
jgi:hypothetical protein